MSLSPACARGFFVLSMADSMQVSAPVGERRAVAWFRFANLVCSCLCLALVAAWSNEAGAGGSKVDAQADSPADRLYLRACGHAARGHLELAYELLAESFGHGLTHPMQVAVDTSLAPLLADSIWRPQVRDLIHRHAWDEEAVMAPRSLPGRRVVIVVRLLDDHDAPVSRAVVDLRQSDAAHPCTPDSGWNPRLFASLRAGDSGRVAVETNLPDTSGNGNGCPLARHLHLTAERQGFAALRGVILLGEDSTAAAFARESTTWGATWTARSVPDTSGARDYQADIRMRRLP